MLRIWKVCSDFYMSIILIHLLEVRTGKKNQPTKSAILLQSCTSATIHTTLSPFLYSKLQSNKIMRGFSIRLKEKFFTINIKTLFKQSHCKWIPMTHNTFSFFFYVIWHQTYDKEQRWPEKKPAAAMTWVTLLD